MAHTGSIIVPQDEEYVALDPGEPHECGLFTMHRIRRLARLVDQTTL